LAGAIAGLCAGYLTFWSRHGRQGRESILNGVLTYYAAALTYALVLGVIGVVVELCAGGTTLRGIELLIMPIGLCWYAFWVATFLGVALIPLCFATRWLFWQICGGKTQLPPNTEESARG
jgi:hypothetical protein